MTNMRIFDFIFNKFTLQKILLITSGNYAHKLIINIQIIN
jgi:hypothetical protein